MAKAVFLDGAKKREAIVGSPGDLAGAGDAEADDDKAARAALQKEEVAMVKADIECPR